MIDWHIDLGIILEILSILGGGFAFLITVRSDLKAVKQTLVQHSDKIDKLADMRDFVARQDERSLAHSKRMDDMARRVEDLAHGRGFIK